MVYGFTIAFMLLALVFGLVGVSVTREVEQYHDYLWVPLVLVALLDFEGQRRQVAIGATRRF